jgi:predicted nucleic acid-binding protein
MLQSSADKNAVRLNYKRKRLPVAFLAARVTVIHPTSIVTDCRDPKDNKFLALALDANVETVLWVSYALNQSSPLVD